MFSRTYLKLLLVCILFCAIHISGRSKSVIKKVSSKVLISRTANEKLPLKFETYILDFKKVESLSEKEIFVLKIPILYGEFKEVVFNQTHNMSAELEAKYSNIKTYSSQFLFHENIIQIAMTIDTYQKIMEYKIIGNNPFQFQPTGIKKIYLFYNINDSKNLKENFEN